MKYNFSEKNWRLKIIFYNLPSHPTKSTPASKLATTQRIFVMEKDAAQSTLMVIFTKAVPVQNITDIALLGFSLILLPGMFISYYTIT